MIGWQALAARFWRETRSTTHVEYGLLVFAIAAGVGIAVATVGSKLGEHFERLVSSLPARFEEQR